MTRRRRLRILVRRGSCLVDQPLGSGSQMSKRTTAQGGVHLLTFNPLGGKLRGYSSAVRYVLQALGVSVCLREGAVDRCAHPLLKLIVHLLQVRLIANQARGRPVLCLWPTLGYLEVIVWAMLAPRTPVWLVFHDPSPLRPQPGLSYRASRWAATFCRAPFRVRLVAHSVEARTELWARGLSAIYLPYPPLPPSSQRIDKPQIPRTLLVLGQYKPSRDLEVMEQLGHRLRLVGLRPEVAGEGWPPIDGWHVLAGHLSEADFEKRLRSAHMVLIPYSAFYQSDVLARAAANGTPVICIRQSQPVDLLGEDYPGLISTLSADEVLDAVDRLASAEESVHGNTGSVLPRTLSEWGAWLHDAEAASA